MGVPRSLEVLDVADPCPEDWGAMEGDARRRRCELCARHVYDLSAMTRDEADALLRETEGSICVRFVRRADGTVTTSDCAPDRLATLRRGAKRGLAFAAVVVGGVISLAAGLGFASLFGYHEIFADHDEDQPCDVPLMGVVPAELPDPEDPPELPEAPPPSPGEDAPAAGS